MLDEIASGFGRTPAGKAAIETRLRLVPPCLQNPLDSPVQTRIAQIQTVQFVRTPVGLGQT
jgi:hypothetical protein